MSQYFIPLKEQGQPHSLSSRRGTALMFSAEKPAWHGEGNEQPQPTPLQRLPSPCVPENSQPSGVVPTHLQSSRRISTHQPAAAWQTRTGHSTPPGFTAHLEQTCCIPLKSREQQISNVLRPLYAPQTGITTNGVSRGHKSLGTAATHTVQPLQPHTTPNHPSSVAAAAPITPILPVSGLVYKKHVPSGSNKARIPVPHTGWKTAQPQEATEGSELKAHCLN